MHETIKSICHRMAYTKLLLFFSTCTYKNVYNSLQNRTALKGSDFHPLISGKWEVNIVVLGNNINSRKRLGFANELKILRIKYHKACHM